MTVCRKQGASEQEKIQYIKYLHCQLRADFREGDEDSNFSVFGVRRIIGPLHCIAFPGEILTPNSSFTECLSPFYWKLFFFIEKCFIASPSQKSAPSMSSRSPSKCRCPLFAYSLWTNLAIPGSPHRGQNWKIRKMTFGVKNCLFGVPLGTIQMGFWGIQFPPSIRNPC